MYTLARRASPAGAAYCVSTLHGELVYRNISTPRFLHMGAGANATLVYVCHGGNGSYWLKLASTPKIRSGGLGASWSLRAIIHWRSILLFQLFAIMPTWVVPMFSLWGSCVTPPGSSPPLALSSGGLACVSGYVSYCLPTADSFLPLTRVFWPFALSSSSPLSGASTCHGRSSMLLTLGTQFWT